MWEEMETSLSWPQLMPPEKTLYLRVLGWKYQIWHIVRQHATTVRIKTHAAH